jgi:hypothetical protein
MTRKREEWNEHVSRMAPELQETTLLYADAAREDHIKYGVTHFGNNRLVA